MNKTFGAALLIAGCAIGTGMLGIPVVTGAAGFFPASILFIAAYLFMLATGLLLAKVTLSFATPEIHLISMAEKTLGRPGKIATSVLFTLLFYAIMIAYCIAGGRIITDIIVFFFAIELPLVFTSSALVLLLFIALMRGVRSVDRFNRYLMVGLVGFYLLLVILGTPHVETERLLRTDWSASFGAIPILVIAFGYHNLVPSLAHYLDRDPRALKKAIIFGSLIPLFIYLVWEYVMLGVISFTERAEWDNAIQQGEIITQLLARACHSQTVVHMTHGFAFFAIATSFLPIAMSFVDFLRDGFQVADTRKTRSLLSLVVLIPPLLIALTKPGIFLTALSYAGGVCTMFLFGLLPVLMAFKIKICKLPLLLMLLVASSAILVITVLHELGII